MGHDMLTFQRTHIALMLVNILVVSVLVALADQPLALPPALLLGGVSLFAMLQPGRVAAAFRYLQHPLRRFAAIVTLFALFAWAATAMGFASVGWRVLPLLGTLNALFFLWWMRDTLRLPTLGFLQMPTFKPGTAPENRIGWRYYAFVAGLTLLMSLWQFSAGVQHITAPDSYEYFNGSEQILGYADVYQSAEEPGFFNEAIITYGYPLVMAISRLIYDHVIGLLLLQHALRLAVILLAVRVLASYDTRLARIAGVLFAVSQLSVVHAHYVLADAVYNLLLLLVVLNGIHLIRLVRLGTPAPLWGVLLGAQIVAIALVRPVGLYLAVPLLVVLYLSTRRWNPLAWVSVGLVVGLLVGAGGRWLLDRTWSISAAESGLYYTVGLAHHDFVRADNGPLAQAIYTQDDTGCLGTAPTGQRPLLLTQPEKLQRKSAHALYLQCQILRYGIDGSDLWLETLQVNPLAYALSVYDEFAYFFNQQGTSVALNSVPEICTPEPQRYARAVRPSVINIEPALLQWACVGYPVTSDVARVAMGIYAGLTLLVPQPHLLGALLSGNDHVGLALALLFAAFIWLEQPRLRPLVLLLLAIFAYHGAVTALTFFSKPRYVLVMHYLLTLVTALLVSVLSQRRPQAMVDESTRQGFASHRASNNGLP